jgi:DNA helicase-2/ATP-dependent DNA helicase PcrA
VRNILNFERDFPGAKVIRLEQNYRSRTNILTCANALIKNNENRIEKDLWSDLGPGEKIKLFMGEDERAEAEFIASQVAYYRNKEIPLKEMVIFYRTNAQSRAFEDFLLYRGLPYVIIGGVSFYQRKEIKDILAFLRFAKSGTDYIAFTRTINIPKRGLGEATIEKIRHGANLDGLTLLAYCEALMKEELAAPARLTSKQKEGLAEYLSIIQRLRPLIKEGSVKDIVQGAIEQTGYLKFLGEDRETFEDRKENLNALIAKAAEWEESALNPSLEAFLEELSLKSNLDELDQADDRLNLMTIHNGKGLEFTVTFLAGLEEDLFPHVNSIGRNEDVEEERRLCYVGMTRAKEFLHLSFCHTRYLWGNLRFQRPSRFLKEIPMDYVEKVRHPSLSPRKSLPAPHPLLKEKMVHVEKPVQPTSEVFQPGDTLFHKTFGIGQVKEAYEGSMGLTYKIYFSKDNSVKTIVAKYTNLSRV